MNSNILTRTADKKGRNNAELISGSINSSSL